jgi:putative FmdB family regulatory protein
MPLYEYQCEECASRFEERRSMIDADRAAVCPICDSLLTRRVPSAGGERVVWRCAVGTG